MVDLVKIRRKAREKKKTGSSREVESSRAEPAGDAASTRSRRRPVSNDDSPVAAVEMPPEEIVEADEETIEPPKKTKPARLKAEAARSRKAEKAPDEDEVIPVEPIAIPEKLQEYRRTAGTIEVQRADVAPTAGEEKAEGAENELLTFVIAGENYAVEIERIVEIIRPRAATRVPNAGASIVGIISLRGMIVTLVDLRRILGHAKGTRQDEDSRIVVVERDGEIAGFEVDRVSRVIKVDPTKMESHPVVSANEQSEFVRGVFRHGPDLMILLDLEKVLA